MLTCTIIAQHSVPRSIPIITRHRAGVPLCPYSFVIVFFCYRILLLSYSFVIVFFSYRILLLSYSFVIVFFCYRILLLSYSFVLAFFCYDSVTPCRCHSYCTTLYIPDIRRCSFVTPIFCSHTIVIQRMHLKHSDG